MSQTNDPRVETHRVKDLEYLVLHEQGTIGPVPEKTMTGFLLTNKMMRVLPACKLAAERFFRMCPMMMIEMTTPDFIPMHLGAELFERMTTEEVVMFSLAAMVATAQIRGTWVFVDLLHHLGDVETDDPATYTCEIIQLIVGLAHRGLGIPLGQLPFNAVELEGHGPTDGPAWDPSIIEFTHTLR